MIDLYLGLFGFDLRLLFWVFIVVLLGDSFVLDWGNTGLRCFLGFEFTSVLVDCICGVVICFNSGFVLLTCVLKLRGFIWIGVVCVAVAYVLVFSL